MKRTVELQLELLKNKRENLQSSLNNANKKLLSLQEEKQRLEKALQKILQEEEKLLKKHSEQGSTRTPEDPFLQGLEPLAPLDSGFRDMSHL